MDTLTITVTVMNAGNPLHTCDLNDLLQYLSTNKAPDEGNTQFIIHRSDTDQYIMMGVTDLMLILIDSLLK